MRNFSFLISLFFCFLSNAQSVSLFNPDLPPTNNNYPDPQYFCAGENFNLKVNATATSTGDYSINTLSGVNIPAASINVPFSNRVGDNHFSRPIAIPFPFEFYGKSYSKLVVGSNGRLLFGTDAEFDNLHTNRYVDKIHSGNDATSTTVKLPNTAYNQIDSNDFTRTLNYAQIFFGYTDLGYYNTADYNKLTYGNITYNGQQGLLINFNMVLERTVGTGYSSTITNQILLLPDNQILIKVVKPNGTKNAIIGMQNETGGAARWPINSEPLSVYNNDKWSSSGSDTFAFTPSLNLTPRFKWFRNGVEFPGQTSDTFDTTLFTSPVLSDGDVLKVEVTYHDPAGTQVGAMVSDDVTFKNIPVPVITSSSSGGCVSGVTLTISANPDLNFEWFRVGNPTVLGTGNTYYATQTGNYFVRASRKTLPICSVDSSPVSVNLNSTIPAFNASNNPLNFCDTTGAPTKSIYLYDYYPQSPSYSVVFTEASTTVPDPTDFVIYANTTRTLNINVNDPVSGCTINLNFTLRYDSLPAAINNLPKKYCFGGTSQDVSQYLQDLAGTNFMIFDYQYSIDGVNYTTNSFINPKTNPKVWIKISPKNPPAGSCTTVSTIIFTEDNEVEIKPYSQFPAHCTSPTEFFDLNITKSELEYSPDIKASFYTDSTLSNEITNLNYRGSGPVYIKVENTVTGCMALSIPTLTLVIYSPPTLIKNGPEQKLSQCGTTQFDLTTNINDYINWTRYSEIRYFDGNGNPLTTPAQYKNYDASVSGFNPYMIFVYNETNNLNCSNRIDFNLIEIKKPVAITNQIQICAETIYSLQDFKNKVASNPSLYIFTDLSGTVLINDFTWSTLPFTVNFLMKDIANNCVSNPQTVTFLQGGSSSILTTQTDYFLCDSDFDGKTEFNLDSQKSNFTTDNTAFFEYFKNSILSQKIDNPTIFTNDNPFEQTVYAKITIPGFCPSVAQIHLKVNTPTKSSTLEDQYFICYGESLTIYGGSDGVDGSKNVAWEYNVEGVISTDENLYLQNPKPGTYTVKLTNVNGCSYTHSFIISDENQPKIDVINQTNNSIEVIASGGTKPYRYYFNGVPQTSNILQNPTAASYEIQVESATGCFGQPKTIYFIKINNAFTPNADGINDFWKIDNLDKMETVSLVIIDRNGKKVFESTNPAKTEWDGKAFGRELPTSSYWYIVSWFDAVTQKNEQRQGWILLKNRN